MNATLSGLNLCEILVRVSLAESPSVAPPARAGVRTHGLLPALVGIAAGSGSRRALVRETARWLRGKGIYYGSHEDLTPWRDPISLVPLLAVLAQLLLQLAAAHRLTARTVADYAFSPSTIELLARPSND